MWRGFITLSLSFRKDQIIIIIIIIRYKYRTTNSETFLLQLVCYDETNQNIEKKSKSNEYGTTKSATYKLFVIQFFSN